MRQLAKVTDTSPLTVAYKTAPDTPVPVQGIDASVPVLDVDDDVIVDILDRRLLVLHKIEAV